MKRLLFCVFLMFVSCNNNQITNSKYDSSSLSDNESLIYDNYKFSNTKKRMDVKLVPQEHISLQEEICSTSCVRRPLQIAILPINAGGASMMSEIQNALTILKFGVNYSKYTVNVVEGTTLAMQSIQAMMPDVIVGPFNEKDVLAVQKQISSNHTKTPIVSLASKNISGGGLYNFGYRAEVGINSIMSFAKSREYKNLVMFASNNEIGGSNYKMFSSAAKGNKQEIPFVEFYEANSDDLSKYISRLKSATIQIYYQNVNSGKIQKDDFNFTKDITANEENVVTHSSGERFYKKYKKVDAVIIDASAKDFQRVYRAIASEEAFKDIPLIGSPRIVDGIMEMLLSDGEKYEKEIVFPSNFEKYRDYYEIYKNTFNQAPTRFSATIYETMQYLLNVHQIKAIDNIDGIAMNKGVILDGVNGKMIPDSDGRTIRRVVDVYSFQNGDVQRVGSQLDNAKIVPNDNSDQFLQ